MTTIGNSDEAIVLETLTPKKTRKMVAEWATDAWKNIPEDQVYNSWRHTPFSHFPDEETRETNFDADKVYYSSSSEEDEDGEEEQVEEEEQVGV